MINPAAERALLRLKNAGISLDDCQGMYFMAGFANGYQAGDRDGAVEYARSRMDRIIRGEWWIADRSKTDNIVHFLSSSTGDHPYADLPDGEWYGEKAYMLGVAAGIAEYRKEQACLQTTKSDN